MPRGIDAVDDDESRMFPAVTRVVDGFLGDREDFSVLANLNRHGAIGRKIYLARTVDATRAAKTRPWFGGDRGRAIEPGRRGG